jgi:hypothetical protein
MVDHRSNRASTTTVERGSAGLPRPDARGHVDHVNRSGRTRRTRWCLCSLAYKRCDRLATLAKSMTAVDVVSGGRATFVLGAGYLRSEFLALGVDFEERNALFERSGGRSQGSLGKRRAAVSRIALRGYRSDAGSPSGPATSSPAVVGRQRPGRPRPGSPVG